MNYNNNDEFIIKPTNDDFKYKYIKDLCLYVYVYVYAFGIYMFNLVEGGCSILARYDSKLSLHI